MFKKLQLQLLKLEKKLNKQEVCFSDGNIV